MMKKFFYLTAILTIVLVSCNSEKKYKEKLSNATTCHFCSFFNVYFALFLPIYVNHRKSLSTIVNFLHDLSNRFPVANLRDPNTVQK